MIGVHCSPSNMTIMAQKIDLKDTWSRPRRDTGRESIHSGHFMISDFEAEAQDDEDELAVPVPDVAEPKAVIPCRRPLANIKPTFNATNLLSIETSLTKLFQCMSIAYRYVWSHFRIGLLYLVKLMSLLLTLNQLMVIDQKSVSYKKHIA